MDESELQIMSEKKESVPMNTGRRNLHDRILACLYAGGLGDALGYVVEFNSWPAIKQRFGEAGIREPELTGGKAVFSDDTQMTLFTAEGIILGSEMAAESSVPAETDIDIWQAYLCWYETQGGYASSQWDPVSKLLKIPELNRRRAPGNTCLSALGSGRMGTIETQLNNSKGCGGVMRTAPLGFVRQFGSPLENGAKAAAITHSHPMGWIPAGMHSDIIERCLYGDHVPLQTIIEDSLAAVKEKYGHYPEFPDFEDLIHRAVALAVKNKASGADDPETDEEAIRSLGEGWVGDEALAIAVYASLRWDEDIKKCLCAAVNHSGDSDSTGAVAGNILGAYLGLDAIPRDWLDKLELTGVMEDLADGMIRIMDL